ncbi:GNAT family N-acetyltransferase [Streptomyces sp. NBC_00335]|uniref:GNAT family N-acetyltransferase n=1 Tax=unclassified Streptomyces TaxID=2593676 RepID=UPI0022549F21|nr:MULTISPECIES: GNAT family N-acetyltransferase [unclassified Streptomyces]MCX5405888.1 GNAT family N-acetyltransferase [Streptomyces sp. NBC_00086]
MIIRTGRLTLLPLEVAHADEMAAVLGDPELHGFIGGAPLTAPELRTRYARLVAGSPDPAVTWCNWVVRLDAEDCLTGTVQATVSGEVAEIAWVIGTPWQRRGIAVEATRAMAEWLGAQAGVRRLIAHVHPDHTASAAVAARVGLAATDRVEDGEIRWEGPA